MLQRHIATSVSALGCPGNNKKNFSVRTETNRNLFCFEFFRFVSRNQTTFFSVCFGVLDLYQNNRNKQNFLETNRKTLQKPFSIRRSSKPLILFLGPNWNRNSVCLGCFSVCFYTKPKNFFCRFVSMFRTGIETTETNRTYGMKKGWYFNKFAAVSVCLLFASVFLKHRNSVSILKRNNRNKRLVSDSAETSFGCFDTKLKKCVATC
jgi:hypothetical protein